MGRSLWVSDPNVVPVMNTVRTEKAAAPAGQGATTKE
jgi:hypothetical protein